ncbi:MAG: LSm family protein [Candidatus Rehaiarchaeum fermentans]|nr:LSm family protein [Candidatus Rehaiarchaeum fermentans]MCW1292560.1 LSm family protein [Candidatus Rehaiarchaeum fermentans]MCW1293223.1 LSm family protein [Candidatus Rehaiarchaeum fermentans]MCW1297405.1 LSm family protein [Candidatus Rehaiarchaeum fermentans]MCW1302462.1 LSm family protein [Candidatus Rehaiarchaeum fermentans]
MAEQKRPFDVLNESKGKNILVELKNGKTISGKLIAFDPHINISMENAKEVSQSGETVREVGKLFIRGDMIISISPGE